ncbi:MAG: LysM peptidoglycan-binding domain-containing protein, partial [Myxococcota bacterium]
MSPEVGAEPAGPSIDPPAAGPTTEPRGGFTYVIQRGDSLSRISERVYGSPDYWREIMRANPTKVARGGDLILTGDELVLPVIAVPVPSTGPTPTPTPAPAPAPAPEVPEAPETPAIEPSRRTTDFGDFLVY